MPQCNAICSNWLKSYGIQNIANNCYASSIVQLVRCNERLSRDILSRTYGRQSAGTYLQSLLRFDALFLSLSYFNIGICSRFYSTSSPYENGVSTLHLLRACGFEAGFEEDAQEFLLRLLNEVCVLLQLLHWFS